MNGVGHAIGLAADHQRVVVGEAKIDIVDAGARRQQDQPAAPSRLVDVGLPRPVAHQVRMLEIVHPGAPQMFVGHHEAGRLDEIDRDPETGGEAQYGAGILRNVGLIQSETNIGFLSIGSVVVKAAIDEDGTGLANHRNFDYMQ